MSEEEAKAAANMNGSDVSQKINISEEKNIIAQWNELKSGLRIISFLNRIITES